MFKGPTPYQAQLPVVDIKPTAEFIVDVQKPNGEIPWSRGGKTDPWDHVESTMGLTIGGFYEEARKAFQWSSRTQLQDGSWWSYYRNGKPVADAYKDSNMTAYIAVGILHYYLSTGDIHFLQQLWPTVRRAMDFVIKLQGDGGEIFWAQRADGSIDKRALLTGSSSIYMSITSATYIAEIIGEEKEQLEIASIKLGDAIRYRPHLFDQNKSRYAMDWYYPILSGTITGEAGIRRIERSWDTFIIPGWGVRCVSDKPWVTMAETAELAIALAVIGQFEVAEIVFGWIKRNKYDDGAFWTGVTLPDRTIYTIEKTTWTAAVVLLANDVLYSRSPASRVFGLGPGSPIACRPVSSPRRIDGPLKIVQSFTER